MDNVYKIGDILYRPDRKERLKVTQYYADYFYPYCLQIMNTKQFVWTKQDVVDQWIKLDKLGKLLYE